MSETLIRGFPHNNTMSPYHCFSPVPGEGGESSLECHAEDWIQREDMKATEGVRWGSDMIRFYASEGHFGYNVEDGFKQGKTVDGETN